MESVYCKNCSSIINRFQAACAAAKTDGCTQSTKYKTWCEPPTTEQQFDLTPLLRFSEYGVCGSCYAKPNCDLCTQTAGCTWSMVGCVSSQLWTDVQNVSYDGVTKPFAPGATLGCTWEAGKCYDFCNIAELQGNDVFDYGNAAEFAKVTAAGIQNFEFSAMKAAFPSSIGQKFAKAAASDWAAEDKDGEWDDDDKDDDDKNDQQPQTKPASMTTSGGCAVDSDHMLFNHIFDIPSPAPPPASEPELSKESMQTVVMSQMYAYQTSFQVGALSEKSIGDLMDGDGGNGDDRRRLLDEHGGDEGDGMDAFSGCLEVLSKGAACPADCKVNICADPETVPLTGQFIQVAGTCLTDELKKKCCADNPTAADLALLGTPGSPPLPPTPMIQVGFLEKKPGSQQVKGDGGMFFFLSLIEYDVSKGAFSGNSADIIQEIELDKGMGYGANPVVNKNVINNVTGKSGDEYIFNMTTNDGIAGQFKFSFICGAGTHATNITSGFRTLEVDWDAIECDLDFENFPFKNNGSAVAVKTAYFSMKTSFDMSEEESEDDEDAGEDTISTGGALKYVFAKEAQYTGPGCNSTSCKTPVKSSAHNIDCGTIGWYTPAYKAITQRDMGFNELKCTYWSFMGGFRNDTKFTWDPKVKLDAEKVIKASQAKSSEAGPPKVVIKAPPKAGETIAGVDKPATTPASTPVVKVKYAMPITKFDKSTSDKLKEVFASKLGNNVKKENIKITKATFEIKSKLAFASETVDSFKAKEETFKVGLAKDLSTNVTKITVTTAAARRHLLAGITVDYTVTGIETFETANSMKSVARSASALTNVQSAVSLPAVKSAGVEAKVDFEIAVENDAAATSVATKLADPNTLSEVAAGVPDVNSFTVEGQVTTVAAPPPPPPPLSSGSARFNSIVLAIVLAFAAFAM